MRSNPAADVTVVSADMANAHATAGPTTTAVHVTSKAATSTAKADDAWFRRGRGVDRTKSAATAEANRAHTDLLTTAKSTPRHAAAMTVAIAIDRAPTTIAATATIGEVSAAITPVFKPPLHPSNLPVSRRSRPSLAGFR